jgi:hypothetical protein
MNLSLESASTEFGINRRTVRRRLVAAGLPIGKGKSYTLKQIFDALAGHDADVLAAIDRERLRKLTAESERIELDVAKASGEMLEMDKVQAVWAEWLIPLKQALWHFDAPESVRRGWLAELRDIPLGDYFAEAKPVEEDGLITRHPDSKKTRQ